MSTSFFQWSTIVNMVRNATNAIMAMGNGGATTAPIPSHTLIWRARFLNALLYAFDLLSVSVIYLFSELVIWGLSQPLRLARLQYFSSVLGMVLVLGLMVAAHNAFKKTAPFYLSFLKGRVDFINAQLGLGFPIPLVMLDDSQLLDPRQIARIMANFVVTNVFSWVLVFGFAFVFLAGFARVAARTPRSSHTPVTSGSDNSPESNTTPSPGSNVDDKESRLAASGSQSPHHQTSLAAPDQPGAAEAQSPPSQLPPAQRLGSGSSLFPLPLALLGLLALGVPVALVFHDHRLVDGFSIWFIWVLCVRLQKVFKSSSWMASRPRAKNILATLMNPVLFTTLLLIAYTRLKVVFMRGSQLSDVLRMFSGGSPLYALWTAKVTGNPIERNPSGWFGAGDLALSLLECGLVVWGFKLYECRAQLFSLAGFCTIVISVFAAVGNVFLSTLAGRAMGLEPAEALSFSARSVTLALSKPAMQVVGGNVAVNAALVVGNGILGQLMYPFVLHRLSVQSEVDEIEMASLRRVQAHRETPPQARVLRKSLEQLLGDTPSTIAAGVTVGINGAAMGVAYLYATKSRAAPYAALGMTVFGLMTVVLITVDPFKHTLTNLANM